MQHEALFGFAFEAFEPLHIVACTESSGYQGLGFTASENRAAVSSGEDAASVQISRISSKARCRDDVVARSPLRGKCVPAEFEILFQLGELRFLFLRNFGWQLCLISFTSVRLSALGCL